MTNKNLWDKILRYDLDNPPSEYGFSTRLAKENYWTREFTTLAILEYKKFMYLASTSELMVSPSEIVDKVWHQHLIFTQSYLDFGHLLGKHIQHIPSTHNKAEFEKFKQAKDRTQKLYTKEFGEQPSIIWDYRDMYDSLNLSKSKHKIRTGILIGILAFAILIIPAYFLLLPLYLKIDNPYFIFGYISICVLTLIGLELYNKRKLKSIITLANPNSFLYKLHPYELIYLKTQKLELAINGTVNQLIDKESIIVHPDYTVELANKTNPTSLEELQVTNILGELGQSAYPDVLRQIGAKPVFWNIVNSMEALKKYFNKSKKFGNLFYLNFSVLSFLLLLGIIRCISGTLRDKPILLISIYSLVFLIVIVIYLIRLANITFIQTIPEMYKTKIINNRLLESNWQWKYYLFGPAVMNAAFIPLIKHLDQINSNNSSSRSSCGSSCGSSCSSCGGCGGD